MKTFYKAFVDSLETMYRSAIPYLAAQYNSGVKLVAFAPNDGTDEVRVEIQRRVRLTSVKTGVDARDMDRDGVETATAKYAGNALVARLNKLQRVTWESVTVVPGEEQIIGVTVSPREEKDILADASGFEKTIAARAQEHLEDINEIILNELITGVDASQIIKGLKTDGTDDKGLFVAAQKGINAIRLFVDKFKKYTRKDVLLLLAHPDMASGLGRHKGEIYQGVPELFDTGVAADFQIDGVKSFQEEGINAMPQKDFSQAQDGSDLQDLLGIAYDIEGLAVGDPLENKTDFDDTMLGQRYVGTRWNEIIKHFDKKRVVLFYGTKLTTGVLNQVVKAGN